MSGGFGLEVIVVRCWTHDGSAVSRRRERDLGWCRGGCNARLTVTRAHNSEVEGGDRGSWRGCGACFGTWCIRMSRGNEQNQSPRWGVIGIAGGCRGGRRWWLIPRERRFSITIPLWLLFWSFSFSFDFFVWSQILISFLVDEAMPCGVLRIWVWVFVVGYFQDQCWVFSNVLEATILDLDWECTRGSKLQEGKL